MSETINNPLSSLDAATQELRGKWGWVVALGAVCIVAGAIALGSVVLATVVTVNIVGAMMVISGLSHIVSAFQLSWGRLILWIVLGVLYILAGWFTFANPLLVAGALTLLLGAALVAAGVVRIVIAFQMPSGSHWIWTAISAAFTGLLGLMILAQWPSSALWVLGTLLGVDLLIAGFSWLNFGMALRARS